MKSPIQNPSLNDAGIEPVLPEESNEKSGFLEEILKTGEIIYSVDMSA